MYSWGMHRYEDLITLFNDCFFATYNTKLVRGDDEPIYLPADENEPYNRLIFAHGYFASALHESAHWLIAGRDRRKLIDFGYWYVPDGRSSAEQALFQSVEVKPQAMEWILSNAAKSPFFVSVDNLNGKEGDTLSFKQAVYNQVRIYCENGLPKRAKLFRDALCRFYNTKPLLEFEDFSVDVLS